MRPAPPVSFHCHAGGALRLGFAMLAAGSAGTLTFWCTAIAQGQAGAGLLLALAVACLAAALAWRHAPATPGELRWDTQTWSFDGVHGVPQVQADLQRWMLLRFTALDGTGTRWLALSAGPAPAAWHAMRAALYSRPPAARAASPATPAPAHDGQAHRSPP